MPKDDRLYGGWNGVRPRRIRWFSTNWLHHNSDSYDAWEVPETRRGVMARLRNSRRNGKKVKVLIPGAVWQDDRGWTMRFYPDGRSDA